MLLIIVVFAFVTLGVKVLLGVALIYALLPADRRCTTCDGETLPLVARRGFRRLGRACRVERRWCPGCGEVSLTRSNRQARVQMGEGQPERSSGRVRSSQ